MNYGYRTWYVTLIAASYLVLCTINLFFLAVGYFHPGAILLPRQALTLAGAAFSWLYFFQPSWGHKGLIVLTLLAFLAIGESDPKATVFQLAILALLMAPYLTRRQKPTPEPVLTR